MLKKSELFGKGEVEIDLAEFVTEEETRRELIKKFASSVKKTVTSKDYKPPLLPEVAVRLSEMVDKPNVSIKEVESAVVRDPTVAARVVAVANSVFYSRGATVKSLKDAIMRLGLAEVRDVAFQAVAKTTIFRVPGFTDRMRELFTAAQASGMFAKKICQILKFQSESAYLCGLLHDMGEAIILGIAAPRGKDQGAMSPLEKAALFDAIRVYHARTGAMVASMWGLPNMVCDAVLHHHKSELSEDPAQMALVTAVSDLMARHVGIGVEKSPVDPMKEPLFYKLNLSPSDVGTLLSFAEEVFTHRDALD